MSEFGNETATATIKVGEKSIEALMKLLKFIMERNDNRMNNTIKKEQIRQMKINKDKEIASEYLNKRRGYARVSKLLKSGEKLIPLAASMSPNELSRFNKLAKIEGVAFAAISDQQVLEQLKSFRKELRELEKIAKKEGLTKEQFERKEMLHKKESEIEKSRQDRIVIICAKDLELVKNITDRMNMELEFTDIDNELNELLKKGKENITPEEKVRVEQLLNEKHNLLKGEFVDYNDKSNDTIYESIVDKPKWEDLSFERAINRVTERNFSEEPCYVCERTNPNNYMQVSSQIQEHDGRRFNNTEFKVYKNGEEQTCDEFKHGKFTHYSRKDGENSSKYGDEHWKKMKTEIKEKGGFSDDVCLFSDKESWSKYREDFNETKDKIKLNKDNFSSDVNLNDNKDSTMKDAASSENDVSKYKDYMGIINQLKGQLIENNIEINKKNEISTWNHEKESIDRIDFAEAKNIAKQIEVYKKLNENQTELVFFKQQQETYEDNFEKQGRPEILKNLYEQTSNEFYQQVYDRGQTIASLEGKVFNLQIERERLWGAKIVDKMQKQLDKDLKEEIKTEKPTHREENHVQSKEQWNKDVRSQNVTAAKTEKVKIQTLDESREI